VTVRAVRRRARRPGMRLAAAGAALLLASACGASAQRTGGGGAAQRTEGGASVRPAGGGGTSAAAPGGGATVRVKDFSFEPKQLTVPVGSKVTWTFQDSAKHNVSAKSPGPSSGDLSGGASYSFTFAEKGSYAYVCSIHQYMTGTVVVQ
jgi:plastocyanin